MRANNGTYVSMYVVEEEDGSLDMNFERKKKFPLFLLNASNIQTIF